MIDAWPTSRIFTLDVVWLPKTPPKMTRNIRGNSTVKNSADRSRQKPRNMALDRLLKLSYVLTLCTPVR